MIRRVFTLGALIVAVAGAACSVDQSSTLTPSGPSGYATSINVTATPDTINRDGSSQSTVVVTARNAEGQAISGLGLRIDMAVGGVAQDFGTISARNLVTDSNGRATTVYRAPAPPSGGASFSETSVTIRATPVGTNNQASNSWASADIRLTPQGVILPPENASNGPVAAFSVSPAAPTAMVPTQFDASASCGSPGCNGAHQITSYDWSFGDGASGSGRTITHTFATAHDYTVSLTITNDVGQTATKTVAVSVKNPTPPGADFVFSPATPVVGQDVFFNGDPSTTDAGHNITQMTWIFGDGAIATGLTAVHAFSQAGSYDVTLSISDDAGQKSTTKKTVVVGTGNPVPVITASTGTPVSTVTLVSFDGASSTTSGGTTIVGYLWDFGDPSSGSNTSTLAAPTHTFLTAGPHTIRLTITDSLGRSGTTTIVITAS